MLFRAYVYSCCPHALSEVAVFFEAPCTSDAPQRLAQVVAMAWDVPPEAVQHYNLFSERELRGTAGQRLLERGADTDTALLENGHDEHGVSYLQPTRTHVLTGPRWHARISAAQQLVEQHRLLRRFHDLAERTLRPVPVQPAAQQVAA